MRLSEKQLLIVTVAAIVLVIGGGAAWIYFLYNDYQALKQEIVKLEAQKAERTRKAKKNEELNAFFQSEAYKKEMEALRVQVPEESPTGDTDLWTRLNRMRKDAHPQILMRRVEPVLQDSQDAFKPPAGVRKMVYRVELRGSFYDILEFLSELENSDRIIRIAHFEFKRRMSESSAAGLLREGVMMEASVRLMTFEFEKLPTPALPAAPSP